MKPLNAEQLQAVLRRDEIITARFQLAIACCADSIGLRDMNTLNQELAYFNGLLGIGSTETERRGGEKIRGVVV